MPQGRAGATEADSDEEVRLGERRCTGTASEGGDDARHEVMRRDQTAQGGGADNSHADVMGTEYIGLRVISSQQAMPGRATRSRK